MEGTLHRIKKYIDYKGISVRMLEMSVGMSNGSFASQLKNNKTIGVDKLENILRQYQDVNPEWLLTGEGEMLKSYTTPIIAPNDITMQLIEKNSALERQIGRLEAENQYLRNQIFGDSEHATAAGAWDAPADQIIA